MPRKNRRDVFNPLAVSCNHCVVKCVRGLFLLSSGKLCHARKLMMENRIIFLARHFGIDVLAIAFMSNHIHFLLRNRPDVVETLTDQEVARRWLTLFPGDTKKRKRKCKSGALNCPTSNASTQDQDDHLPSPPSEDAIKAFMKQADAMKKARVCLSDISWLMRAFNQYVATVANREDNVAGRFWQGRFHLQSIVDEAALLACTIYIDLNPIRANAAETLEDSHFTSALARVRALRFEAEVAADEAEKAEELDAEPTQSKVKPRRKPKSLIERLDIFLVPIELSSANALDPQVNQLGARASDRGFLNMTLDEYIQLLEYVGKLVHPNKRGKIAAEAESILKRLNINPATFERAIDPRNKLFKRGTRVQLAEVAAA